MLSKFIIIRYSPSDFDIIEKLSKKLPEYEGRLEMIRMDIDKFP